MPKPVSETALRLALLIMALALMTGAIWGAANNAIGRALVFFFLAFLCFLLMQVVANSE